MTGFGDMERNQSRHNYPRKPTLGVCDNRSYGNQNRSSSPSVASSIARLKSGPAICFHSRHASTTPLKKASSSALIEMSSALRAARIDWAMGKGTGQCNRDTADYLGDLQGTTGRPWTFCLHSGRMDPFVRGTNCAARRWCGYPTLAKRASNRQNLRHWNVI